MKRRDFLKHSVAAATVATGLSGMSSGSRIAAEESGLSPVPVYRTLGRTGLKVAVVSFGAGGVSEYELIQAGIDKGVNFIDTARIYMDGRNEEIVGKAIKGRRDKIHLATKTQPKSSTKKDIFQDVETSLSKLKTEYIDILQLHKIENKDKSRMFDPEVREALLELRKQGKVRFFGISSHTDQTDILDALATDPTNFFDTALVAYNFESGPELKAAIARAAKAGIGIIAMKTQAGGYKTEAMGKVSPHQAALKWVLQDTNVATTIPGMKDLAMLRENLAVMGMKLTSVDTKILERYSRAIKGTYCRMCARCESGCPRSVTISTVNRSLMYAEGYQDLALARTTYRDIAPAVSAAACRNCAECVAHCIHGLDIGAKMQRALTLLA